MEELETLLKEKTKEITWDSINIKREQYAISLQKLTIEVTISYLGQSVTKDFEIVVYPKEDLNNYADLIVERMLYELSLKVWKN